MGFPPDVDIFKTEFDVERCKEMLDDLLECELSKGLMALHTAYCLTHDTEGEHRKGRELFLEKIAILEVFKPAWNFARERARQRREKERYGF